MLLMTMENRTLLVMIDVDTGEHEIFNMAVEDLDEPIDCLYFIDCESAISHFSRPGVTARPTFALI